jgi:hypothetical protein
VFQANQLAETLAPVWSTIGLPDPDTMGMHFDTPRIQSTTLISGTVAIVGYGGLRRSANLLALSLRGRRFGLA